MPAPLSSFILPRLVGAGLGKGLFAVGLLAVALTNPGSAIRAPSVALSAPPALPSPYVSAESSGEYGADGPPLGLLAVDEMEESAPSPALTPQEAFDRSPFVELGALDSRPGESEDEFLVRVARVMDAFTRHTNHEACAVIMIHDSSLSWRARVTTNRSHLSCTMVLFDEPGFSRWGPDIHSHPYVPDGVLANAQDVLRNPHFQCGQHIKIFDERFSGQDLERGEGYLVSRGRLLYQDGHPQEAPVAFFEPLMEMPELALSEDLPWGELSAAAAAAAAWSNDESSGFSLSEFPKTACEGSPTDAQEEEVSSEVSVG